MRTVLSCLFRNMSEPDKKIQKEMTNAAGMIKLSIYKEKVPIYCVFVTEISRNTYSLLTTWKCCPARSSWARTRLVYVTIMRCGNHFGIFTSGQLQSRPRCWILKSLLFWAKHTLISVEKKKKNHRNCFGVINSQSYLLQPPSTSPSVETHSESLSTCLAHSYLLYIVVPYLHAANCCLAHTSWV